MHTSNQLRQQFLDYFKTHGHTIIDSSPVVPIEDDTLLFANSGMVQFKENLLGIPNKFSNLTTACSSQRCIRAGGKHNDLDDVGKDTYHHTFFEMLGNWSFGDYFKEKAIFYAWDFLVNTLKLKEDRIYVTYFSDPDSEIPEDLETLNYWLIYLPRERILKGNLKDNFWEMAEIGPCGPCTEIHYDRIGNRNAANLVNQDDPTVIEIWNVVFMQYNRTETSLNPLNKPCIDTGIGFERLLSILNQKNSNYLTDLFLSLFDLISEESTDLPKYSDSIYGEQFKIDMAFRVLADHSRTIAVCLYDGVEFSSEGRGYVLRRICRRAIRYAHEVLNLKKGFLSKITKRASEILNLQIEEFKLQLIDNEETLFLRTLDRGTSLFYKIKEEKGFITGKDAFILYDTFGFPFDLTKILAEENNLIVNVKDFERELEDAKEKSRTNKKQIDIVLPDYPINTDDSFVYYERIIVAKLLYYVTEPQFTCAFDKTCFYSEKGGQVGDTGEIYFLENNIFIGKMVVNDTKSISGTIFHFGNLEGKIAEKAVLVPNLERRSLIAKNHTATHLLNYTLRNLFKVNIEQKGSLVTEDRLRFDFSFSRPLELHEIEEIETRVNELIDEAIDVEKLVCRFEDIKLGKPLQSNALDVENILKKDFDLKKEPQKSEVKDYKNYTPEEKSQNEDCNEFAEGIKSLVDSAEVIYLKNEKYPEFVRNIKINSKNHLIQELCGGTHVNNTSEIVKFRIISENSISANTRRIVAFTHLNCLKSQLTALEILKDKLDFKNQEVPLLMKKEIELSENKKFKDLLSLKNEFIKADTLNLKHKIEQRILKKDVYPLIYISESDKLTIKDFQKHISKLAVILETNNLDGMICAFVEETIYFYLVGSFNSVLESGIVKDRFVKKINNCVMGHGKCSKKDLLSIYEDVVTSINNSK